MLVCRHLYYLTISFCNAQLHHMYSFFRTETVSAETRSSADADKSHAMHGQSVSQVTKLGIIWYIRNGFLLLCYSNFVRKMHRFWDIRLQKCCDLENRVRGTSRSLEMSPFDRAHMTSCWCSIVTMALSHVISEIFNVEKYRDLEILSRVKVI